MREGDASYRTLGSIVGLPHEVRTAGGFRMRLCVFCGNSIILAVENKTQDNKTETLRAARRVGGGCHCPNPGTRAGG